MDEEQNRNERKLWKSVLLQYYLLAALMFGICCLGGWFFGYAGFAIPATLCIMVWAALVWRINH